MAFHEILPLRKITEVCKKHPIVAKLSLFGSALSGTLGQESDIDLLVEFEPGKTPSLFVLIDLEDELTTVLGRKADLRTPEELSRYFRNEVVANANGARDDIAKSRGNNGERIRHIQKCVGLVFI